MELDKLIAEIKDNRLEVERIILATPSGETRNKMTEANIHLMEVLHLLHQCLDYSLKRS